MFVFCKLAATLDKQIAGGLLYNYMYHNEDYILQLCLCNLCRSTCSFHVGRQGQHSKQCLKYFACNKAYSVNITAESVLSFTEPLLSGVMRGRFLTV